MRQGRSLALHETVCHFHTPSQTKVAESFHDHPPYPSAIQPKRIVCRLLSSAIIFKFSRRLFPAHTSPSSPSRILKIVYRIISPRKLVIGSPKCLVYYNILALPANPHPATNSRPHCTRRSPGRITDCRETRVDRPPRRGVCPRSRAARGKGRPKPKSEHRSSQRRCRRVGESQ